MSGTAKQASLTEPPAVEPEVSRVGGRLPGAVRFDADQADTPFADNAAAHGGAYFEQMRRKLRWRLLVAYVAPLVLLLTYFHFESTRTLREGVNLHLASVADNQRNTVDLFLQERTADVRKALADLGQLRPAPTHSVMDNLLAGLRAKSSAFVDVGLFSPDGTLLAYAGPYDFLEGRSYGAEPWLKQVLAREDGALVSDVYLGFRGEPHFIIAQTQQFEGQPWTLRASVDPQEFAEFIGRSHLVEQADVFIVNQQGRRQTFTSREQLERDFPLPELPPGETVVAERTVGSTTYLSAVAPLRAAAWTLVVMVPKRSADAVNTRARIIVGLLLLLATTLVVALALRSTGKLVSRLERADTDREDLTQHLFNAAKLASVGEMAAGVAHEINNPLAIIYETAGVMKDTLDPEFGETLDPVEMAEHVTVIQQATLRGRNITRQLMAFARKHEPEREPLDANTEIKRALAIKKTDFSVSNIEVVTELGLELPAIVADANQLEQVLLNLLNNARDAMGEKGTLTVRTRLEGEFVAMEVQDTGCGMSAKQMAQAFFPFFTTKEVGRGTGLGLSISYGIIKALGGRIVVESNPGAGTVFFVFLPTTDRPAGPPEARASRRGIHGH